MTTLKNNVNPLNWQVPITNKDGTPTGEFMRKWLQQAATNGSIPDLSTAAAVSALLDLLGVAQGSIIYRDATAWTVLLPGTAGDFLKTQGAGANPEWDTVNSLPSIADGELLANTSGGAAQPIGTLISDLIDYSIGGTHGDILFRGAGGWEVLAADTAGYILSTNGPGADPGWAAASAVINQIYDIGAFISSRPGSSEEVWIFTAVRPFTLPASLTSSQFSIRVNPTATMTWTLKKNGASIGTVAFDTSGIPTVTFASAVSFAIGDELGITSPSSVDATGADTFFGFNTTPNFLLTSPDPHLLALASVRL